MIKKLTYFNLIYGTIYFFQVINAPRPIVTGDQIIMVGLILSIWYNWDTLKIINGQKLKPGKLSLVTGVIIILFGSLMVVDNILRFSKLMHLNDSIEGLMFLIGLEFIFATTIIIQSVWMIKKHLSLKTSATKL